ncbi:diguanylate cyclase [Paracoccus beibuensis]|uniref:diguanylate cyclase n=1 Tax=Paracoccus beibuensis TaxID=547602 RepID=UPI00223F1874|nr:diguanylate cyclase [Paracoccus beibuensis]
MTARILVADGAATARITLKVRLSAVCYDVVAVGWFDQLAAQLATARPDLIILGGGFPDCPASDICKQLTSDVRYADIPVLMLVRPSDRLGALKAGATATLDPDVEDQMLMARVRGILRDAEHPQEAQLGLAEAPAAFSHVALPQVVLIADSVGRALRWRQLLSDRMAGRFDIQDPDEALGAAASGRTADLYLIAADIRNRGDGLRLLSELRSRQGSRDAGFVIAIAPEREELAAIALDLGAGDVLSDSLGGSSGAQAAAMSLQKLLSRKTKSDQRRAEVQRHMVWAMTDPLTGLSNRRHALPKLAEMARDALMSKQGFCVLAIDLDHFKAVNDRHGHMAGDAVLAEVAHRLRDTVGGAGLVARMGGEEFLCALGNCTVECALRMAEALRRAVQDEPVALPGLSGGGQVRVTASVGVAAVPPGSDGWPDQIARLATERADRALLSAKARGRNRVVSAPFEHAA